LKTFGKILLVVGTVYAVHNYDKRGWVFQLVHGIKEFEPEQEDDIYQGYNSVTNSYDHQILDC